MKKILSILLLISSVTFGQKLALKQIEYAPAAGYCIITNSLGVQTYTPCSSLTSTVIPTLQQVVTKNDTIDGILATSLDGSSAISVSNSQILNQVTGVDGEYSLILNSGMVELRSTDASIPVNLSATSVTKNGVEIATIDQLPVLTASTNITINGSAPNYTISTPTQTTGLLVSTNNLSDISNSKASRNNLGINEMYLTGGDATNTSSVAASISGLATTTLTANKRYYFNGIIITGCNGTGGIRLQATIPTGATIRLVIDGANSSTTTRIFSVITASATLAAATNAVNFAPYFVRVTGEVQMGANTGTVQFGFASGTNGQTSTVYQLGTNIIYYQLN